MKLPKQTEPTPPGFLVGHAGHHWLDEVDHDGRRNQRVVLQWNPNARRWSYSGQVGTGQYVNTWGWQYVAPCEMPEL